MTASLNNVTRALSLTIGYFARFGDPLLTPLHLPFLNQLNRRHPHFVVATGAETTISVSRVKQSMILSCAQWIEDHREDFVSTCPVRLVGDTCSMEVVAFGNGGCTHSMISEKIAR